VTDAVYERVYEPYEGDRTTQLDRIVAIAKEGFQATARSKWLYVLLAATLVHVAIRSVVLYVTGQVDVQGQVPPNVAEQINFNAGFIADTLALQTRWILLLSLALVGAPAIARDVQAGGLSFYFSKPITRSGYAIGKLATPVIVGLVVTALPALIVWMMGVAFTPETLYPSNVWTMPLMILAAGAIVSTVASLVVLGLSALAGSRNLAAVVWVGIGLLAAGASELLTGVTGEDATGLVDLFGAFNKVTELLLGVDASTLPSTGAWLITLGWGLAGLIGLVYVFSDAEVTA
jgi:ABC-type transport system involved in multi-copper enzyme maturation permease subunit